MPHLPAILTRPTNGIRETFYSIDILRGLAALSILIFHYFHFTLGNGTIAIPVQRLEEVSLLRDLSWLRQYGSLAVQLFWTISGFVFMTVYAGQPVTAHSFFVNRFARLYPLHFITLIIVALMQIISWSRFGNYLIYDNNTATNFILNLFFASAWLDADHHSFNGPVWSISVEVLIYVLFWAYVRLFRQNLLSTSIAFAVFFGLNAISHNMIFLCGALFFAGATAYSVFVLTSIDRRGIVAMGAAAVFALWALLLMSGHLGRLPLTIRLLGLFLPALLVLSLTEMIGMQSSYKRFRMIGDITYSTYMWHTPVQMIFLLGAAFGFYSVTLVLNNVFVIGYLLIVVIVAYFSFRFIERPAQRYLRSRLLHTRKPLAAISAP